MRLSLPLLLLLLGAWAIPGGLGDSAPLTATAPQLDDEEKYSAHMPAHLRCDACRAVAYQVSPFLERFPCPGLLKPYPYIYLRCHHLPLMPKPHTQPSNRAQPSTILPFLSHPNLRASVYTSVCPKETGNLGHPTVS